MRFIYEARIHIGWLIMYLEHFGLNEAPFSIAPNPCYLYLTQQHQEALAHLSYGLGGDGGIVLLTGEVGTGKTTISRKLLEDIPAHIEIAWIVNPRLSAQELLASICDELSIKYENDSSSIKIFTDLINRYLIEAHAQGRNVVLMIDEAQNLSPDVLEQLRLLTNLETSERKLLQIILLGQPELKEMLERTDLRQLAQRITARFHLQSLSKGDSCEYIRHRMAIAGCNRPVFSNKAIDLIFSISHGTPRLINLLCDRALLGVYSCHEAMVERKHVKQASQEVLGEIEVQSKSRLLNPYMLVFILIIVNAILLDRVWPWFPVLFSADQAALGQTVSNRAVSDHAVQSKPAQSSPAITESIQAGLMPRRVGSADMTRLEMNQTKTAQPESVNSTSVESAMIEPDISDSLLTLQTDGKQAQPSAPPKLNTQAGAQPKEKPAAQTSPKPAIAALKDKLMEQDLKQSASDVSPLKQVSSTPERLVGTVWQQIEKRGSKQRAFQTLASLWQVNISDEKIEPCKQLAKKKLFCLQRRSNRWLLREYNRPALFQMKGKDGKRHFAVIRSVQQRRAVIQLGQQHWNVALSELEQYWQGQITLLWAKPAAYQQYNIRQGDNGAMVSWLADQMDSIQGKMIPSQVFTTMNAVLTERLKDFQAAEDLLADGIVGISTLIRINERINPNTPLLNHGELTRATAHDGKLI